MLRYSAYDSVLEYRVSLNFKTRQQEELATAERFNTFPEPLQHNEVKNTANSVAKWVWKHCSKRWTNKEFGQVQAERGRLGGLKSGVIRRIGSVTEAEPWEKEGVSRATWYKLNKT